MLIAESLTISLTWNREGGVMPQKDWAFGVLASEAES